MDAVVLTLCAALGFAVGHALQKHGIALRMAGAEPATGVRWIAGMVRQPVWVAGVLVVLLASALDLQAVSVGDLTLVKPLLGLQSAFAVAIGVGVLGERVGRGELAALATMLLGAGLVAATATASRAPESPGWGSAGVFGLSALLAAGLVGLHLRASTRLSAEAAYGLAAGLMFGVSDFMMKRATTLVVAADGGFFVADPGSLASLLRTPEVLWIALANVGAFVCMQLAYRRGRVAVVNPLATLSGTAFAVALGFGVLGEGHAAPRIAGTALVLASAALLVRAGAIRAGDTV